MNVAEHVERDRSGPAAAGYPSYWSRFPEIAEGGLAAHSLFRASDGRLLHRLEMCGSSADRNSLLVLVNPISTPFLLSARLAARLSERYRVVSWENRGGPFLGEGPEAELPTLDRLALDLAELVAAEEYDKLYVVGWCSAVHIYNRAASDLALRPDGLCLIAPSGVSPDATVSPHQQFLAPLIARVTGASASDLPVLLQIVHNLSGAQPTSTTDEVILQRLISMNFESAEALRRFAALVSGWLKVEAYDGPSAIDCNSARQPTHIVHAKDDNIIDASTSINLSRRLQSVNLTLLSSGGHFAHFLQPEKLASFVCASFDGAIAAQDA